MGTGSRAQTFIQPSNGLSRENGPPLCTQMPNWENKTARRPGVYVPGQKKKRRKKTKTGSRAQTFIQPSNGLSRENGPPLCTQMPNWENKTAPMPGAYVPGQKKKEERKLKLVVGRKPSSSPAMGYRGRIVPLSAPRCQTGKTKQHRVRVRMYLARKKKEERKLKLVVGRKPSSSPAMGYRGRMVPLSA